MMQIACLAGGVVLHKNIRLAGVMMALLPAVGIELPTQWHSNPMVCHSHSLAASKIQ
jgi:hypothetical protein